MQRKHQWWAFSGGGSFHHYYGEFISFFVPLLIFPVFCSSHTPLFEKAGHGELARRKGARETAGTHRSEAAQAGETPRGGQRGLKFRWRFPERDTGEADGEEEVGFFSFCQQAQMH